MIIILKKNIKELIYLLLDFIYSGIFCDKDKTFKVWIILYYPKVLHEIGEKSPRYYKKYSRL